jgi:hypothetical protein
MARSLSLKGAEVKLYIGGKLYTEVRNLSYTIDYGEKEIYGIDSPYPQEIRTTRISIQGQVSGVRIKYSGGTQGKGARPKINEILNAPYVAIRVQDRFSQQDILFLPQAKITNENISIAAKGVVKLSFSFKGIIPYGEIDLA